MTLDLSSFRTVFDDDFANDTSLSGLTWSVRWGNADQYSFANGALTLTGYASEDWSSVGFMQAPTGKSAGEGYGLFQFTGYANAGQGVGICFVMWRADNLLVDPASPNVATEIDILESWDGTRTGESVVHYYNSAWAADNGQQYHPSTINLAVSHTYALDWERGSLTYYIDGVQIYQDTTHAPLDYADGGSNEVMGAEVVDEASLVTTPTVQLHITDMSYSAARTVAVPVTVTGGVTLGGGAQSYSAAAGATVQAGSGDDTIYAASGLVVAEGSSGALTFFGGTGSSTVSGGGGAVTIFGGAGGGNYTGGTAGPNVLISQGASGANTTLTGAAGGDQIFGSAAGNDLLVAAVGRESVLGGGGNTTIVGGGTVGSVIFTGGGPTSFYGGDAGGDTVVGGSGSLTVTAQNGDAVFGNTGSLSVSGSTTNADSIIGGSGALTVTGRNGNMLVVAGTSTSTIQTGNGASLIFGSTGSASITGGSGSMEVITGSGNLTVQEGTGPTSYEIIQGTAGGTDILNGFRAGTDSVSIYGYQRSDMSVTSSGGSTLISLSDGTRIQLVGVTDPGSSIHLA